MIQDQLKKGKTPTSLLALQQIADFMTTSLPSMYPAAPQGGMAALNMSKQRCVSVCVCACARVFYFFIQTMTMCFINCLCQLYYLRFGDGHSSE